MKAWRLQSPGGRFELADVEPPHLRAGGVVVRMQAAPVLSYMREVISGRLAYAMPRGAFTPGTNGVGVVEAVGEGVFHLEPGDRVVLSPHHVVDERVREPAQLLIGLTAMGSARFGGLSEAALSLQRAWPDGVFAELAHLPAACATPATCVPTLSSSGLAAIAKFLVPYGGLLRGGLAAGQTVVVNGATGYFGSAGVVLATALGAACVVAAGRDRKTLDDVVASAGARACAVTLTGDVEKDARALRAAAGGGADMALDLVGRADSSASTLATLRSLRRGGRLVLMGSVTEPLPVSVGELLGNDWTISGAFMYPREAPSRLLDLVGAKLLDLGVCRVRVFTLADLDAAMTAAAAMRGLDFVALGFQS